MSEAKIPPITLLTSLIAEFCVPAIRGKVTSKAPVAGMELSPDARSKVGINTPGRTVAYPAEGATVFVDLNEQRAQVWFIHPDAHRALGPVRDALARAVPGLTQVSEASPMPGLGELILLADLGNGRGVRVEISHPAGGPENFFVVRTVGLQITDPAAFKKELEAGKAKRPS